MATVPKSSRLKRVTIASASAGPYTLDFRLFDTDELEVYVNGTLKTVTTDYTISASFTNGYDDAASITFTSALSVSDVLLIYGSMVPDRAADYVNGDPDLTKNMNIELGRVAAMLSELRRETGRTIRFQKEDMASVPAAEGVLMLDSSLNPATGPTATEISNAQTYATNAAASAAAALASQTAAEATVGPVVNKSADYTVLVSDGGGLIRCTAALTLTLPAAATAGNEWVITVKADGGIVTIATPGSETIDGAATLTVSDGSSVLIASDGTNFIGALAASSLTFASLVDDTTPQLGGPLDANGHQIGWDKGADLASATTVTIGTDGNYFDITGTTTIAGFSTPAFDTVIRVRFTSALTLTNSTSFALIGGADISVAAGDIATFVGDTAGNWRMTSWAATRDQATWEAGTDTAPAIPSPSLIKNAIEALNPMSNGYLLARDEKASGTNGGSSVGSTWTKRDLPSSPQVNGITGASIASSVITLPVGTYMVRCSAPVYASNNHHIRLRNTTDGVTEIVGQASRAGSGYTQHTSSVLTGQLTVSTSAKTFEIQHWVAASNAGDGFGVAVGSGEVEIYTVLEIWKI